jgi:7-carboxy-7-deazaguanine synthase
VLGELRAMNYLVNEIFQTIQGEATFTGTPSVFVRLQGCPVGCPWCDTKHTWKVEPRLQLPLVELEQKTGDGATWSEVTTEALCERLKRFEARHVVITGGEPCLYDLRPLTWELLCRGFTVQLETSGTHEVLVDDETWVTVSPKLDMPGGLSVRDDALARADELKHPVGRQSDYDKLRARVIPKLRPGVTVWLQPLSQSAQATALCVALATAHGHCVSVQTHKFLGLR